MPKIAGNAIALLLLFASIVATTQAQTSRYEAIDRSDELQEMVEKLRQLVDEAERARAADRRFIGDLRDLVQHYDWPWRQQIFFDDFRDGDYLRAPAWQLVDGGFRIEPGLGLHTLDQPVEARQPSRQQSSEDAGRELAIAILGSLLEQNQGGESAAKPSPAPGRGGVLQLNAAIPNEFALELALRTVGQQGEIEFLVIGVGPQSEGYRVTYAPGGSPTFEIRRFTARGTSVIAAHYEPLNIHDGAFHQLAWTRHPSGEMQLKVDDRVLLRTSDRTIKSSFDAFQIRYTGGNFAIREIGLRGAR